MVDYSQATQKDTAFVQAQTQQIIDDLFSVKAKNYTKGGESAQTLLPFLDVKVKGIVEGTELRTYCQENHIEGTVEEGRYAVTVVSLKEHADKEAAGKAFAAFDVALFEDELHHLYKMTGVTLIGTLKQTIEGVDGIALVGLGDGTPTFEDGQVNLYGYDLEDSDVKANPMLSFAGHKGFEVTSLDKEGIQKALVYASDITFKEQVYHVEDAVEAIVVKVVPDYVQTTEATKALTAEAMSLYNLIDTKAKNTFPIVFVKFKHTPATIPADVVAEGKMNVA